MAGAFDIPAPPAVELPETPATVPQLQVWQRPILASLVALGIAAVVGLVVWTLTRPDVIPIGLVRFAIVPPDTAPLSPGGGGDLAISPDGTQVVYTSGQGAAEQLTLRPIDQFDGAPVRSAENARDPFFSPDGEWVGFVTGGGAATLQKVSIFGGPPVALAEIPDGLRRASWGADDQIIFGTANAGLFRVSGGGGEPDVLTTLDTEQGETNHRGPFIIPGRGTVLFVVVTGIALTTGQLAVLDLDTGQITPLGLAGVSPQYVSTGHLVYAAQDGSVRAVPFDAASLEVTGNPVPLLDGVMVNNGARPSSVFPMTGGWWMCWAAGAEATNGPWSGSIGRALKNHWLRSRFPTSHTDFPRRPVRRAADRLWGRRRCRGLRPRTQHSQPRDL